MSQDNSDSVAYKSFDGSVEDLFLDISIENDNVRVIRRVSVSVSYLPHEYEELKSILESWRSESSKRESRLRDIISEVINEFTDFSDFWEWASNNVFPLWLTPFITVALDDFLRIRDRGLFYRAFVTKKRVKSLFDYVYSKYRSHFRVKKHRTRHLVITITIPHSDWKNAPQLIVKRLKEVIRYFRRRYGLVFYIAVLELHEDGFPHFHCLFITRKKLHVFKYKKMWRFSEKRKWDKDLDVENRGFIDCFALRGGKKAITRYFMKYVNKFFKYPIENLNVKESVLLYCRLFRIRPVYHSKLPKSTPKAPIEFSPQELELMRKIQEYKRLESEAKTLTDYLVLQKMKTELLNDLINISPNRKIFVNLGSVELESWFRFNVEFFVRQYVRLNKIYCVLGRSCIVFTHN